MDFIHKSCKGNLLPDFDTWFKEMVGDGQASDIRGGDSLCDGEVQAQVQTGAQGAGVRAQGGEVMGEDAGVREGGGLEVKEELSINLCDTWKRRKVLN